MRSMAGEGVYRSELPDFMVFLDWQELPWYWHGFQSFPFAAVMCAGGARHRWRWCSGGSCSARASAASTSRSSPRRSPTRRRCSSSRTPPASAATTASPTSSGSWAPRCTIPATRKTLYVASAIALFGTYLLCRFVVTSRLGRVVTAVRDAELKSRFCGYDSTNYKLFIWTLSAMLCALAGALYVPQVGIINPSEMQPSNSIEMAIWVAVGGRATLVRRGAGRLAGQRRQELAHGRAALGLALRAGRAVRGGDAVPARRPGRVWARASRQSWWRAPTLKTVPKPADGAERRDGRGRRPTSPAADMSALPVIPMEEHDDRPTPISNLPIPEAARPPCALWVGEPLRQLRRVQGAHRRDADLGKRRAALPHRSQRRRQDHAHGLHHRQDPPRQRRRLPRRAV